MSSWGLCIRVAGESHWLSMGFQGSFAKPSRDWHGSGLKCYVPDLVSLFTSGLCLLCVGSILTMTLPCGPKMATASFPPLWLQPSCFTSTRERKELSFHFHECYWCRKCPRAYPWTNPCSQANGCTLWLSSRSRLQPWAQGMEVGRSWKKLSVALIGKAWMMGSKASSIPLQSYPGHSGKWFRGL